MRLEFRADRGQLFAAWKALQVLAEMSDESFVANVHIFTKLANPADRNKYETSVVMALEEADVKIVKQ